MGLSSQNLLSVPDSANDATRKKHIPFKSGSPAFFGPIWFGVGALPLPYLGIRAARHTAPSAMGRK